MKRLLALALLGLLAGQADAQLIKIMSGDSPKKRHKSGNEPPPLGPWYNYWPLEAHFQVPAMPEYPYWGAPQTMPVVPPAPYGAKPAFTPAPAYGMGGLPNGGFAPGGNAAPPAAMPPASNQPQAQATPGAARYPYQANPYPAPGGYPGYGYAGQAFGYNPLQQRPAVAPNPAAQPRP